MNRRFRRIHRSHRTEFFQSFQMLEPRVLMSFTLAPNSAVVMKTSLGEIAVQLYNDMPITTSNFLSYVNSGEYNGTIFHRVVTQGSGGIGVVQGGGFTNNAGAITPIKTNAPIINEWTAAHPNNAGTIAMARTTDINSATSQFYFNTTDNPSLDTPPSGMYADFGNVIRGMGIVDTINALSASGSVTATDGETLNPPKTNSGGYVTINSATEEDLMTVTIGADNPDHDRTVTFTDTNGTTSRITLNTGDATIQFTGTNLTATRRGHNLRILGNGVEMQQVSASKTTANSRLNFSASGKKPYVTLGDINVDGSIKSINGPGVNLTGDLKITGSIKSLKLLAATNAGNISIGTDAGTPRTNVNIGFMQDVNFTSSTPIHNFYTRYDVTDDGTNRGIDAPSIDFMKVYSTLNVSVNADTIGRVNVGTLSGFISTNTFGTLTAGQISNGGLYYAATASSTAGIKHVNVAGAINGGLIATPGSIGSIRAKSIASTTIVAGVISSNFSFGAFPSSFASTTASIGSIRLRNARGKNTSFSASQIAAPVMGRLYLGKISTTAASGSTLGLAGNSIASLKGVTDKNQRVNLKNLSDPAKLATTIADEKLKLGDFQIQLKTIGNS